MQPIDEVINMKYPRITISGARGKYGDDLSEGAVARLAYAFGKTAGPGRVVLSRDGRASGAALRDAAIAGLNASGCTLDDLGLAPTPTVGLFVKESGAVGGIQITASHNPLPYNGMKFYAPDGNFVSPEVIEAIKAGLESVPDDVQTQGAECVCNDKSAEARALHIGRCLQHIDGEAVRRRNFRVAVDGCRSVGGTFVPALLRELGCEVFELDCEPDGAFTRGLEPVPENLAALGAVVRENKADFGLAVDPDADRVAFVDENGAPIGEESGLALVIEHVLSRGELGTVCINCNTTQQVEAVAARHGATVRRAPVGELNVVEAMRGCGSPIGGEGNGGVIYPAIHMGRDALAGTALMLEALERRGLLSKWAGTLPPSVMVKDKVECAGTPPGDWPQKMASLFSGAEVERMDGLRYVLPGCWLGVRLSNTEPIFRIIAEAGVRTEAEAMVEKVKSALAGLL